MKILPAYEIFLHTVEYYGVRGFVALEWFHSYLKDRKQSIFVGGVLLESLEVSYGVPHGSILCPLLFLLYITDLPNSSNTFDYHLFADDTSLFKSQENLNTLETHFGDLFQLTSTKHSIKTRQATSGFFLNLL